MKKLIMVSLLLALSRGVFCMEANAAQVYLPAIKSTLSRGTVDLSNITEKYQTRLNSVAALRSEVPIVTPYQLMYRSTEIKDGSILIMPLQGAVMKEDYCGSLGTRSIVALLAKANQNKNIIGSILYTDSPGGEALGTAEASTNIRMLSKQKPIVTYVDNMMCSAAIWLGTSTNHVVANSQDFTIIGSIGTYITLYLDDPNGPTIKEVYADASKDKNGIFREAKNGNEKPLKEELLNPLNNSFLNAMTRNRYGKIPDKDAVFSGKTFQAKDAIKHGLIDEMGTMHTAVAKVLQLSKIKA